jgi:hypothetical protein
MVNTKELWEGLSDFWTSFENRQEIEDFWEGMLGALQESSQFLHLLYISKYLKYSIPVWDSKYISIDIIKSGAFSNEIEPNIFPLPDYKIGTFDIPSLKCVETGQTMTQGTDYNIIEESKIKFNTNIIEDPHSDKLTFFGDSYKQADPTIYSLYRKLTNLDVLTIDNNYYHPFTFDGNMPDPLTVDYKTEKAIMLKYMSWGVFYLRKQMPTVKNLIYLYNILYNLPFNYEAGVAEISGNTCKIGEFTYYIDSGESWSISDGDSVEIFQPLTGGVVIKDRINDESYIKSHFGDLQIASGVVVNIELLSRSAYMQTVIDNYQTFHKPKNLNIKYNVH